MRTLSTRPTPLLKFALPPLWLALAGYALWLIWVRPEVAFGGPGPAALGLQSLLSAVIAISLVVLFAFVIPLKRVRLAPDGLRVSNYRRDITIPFTAVARVRQAWLPTFRLVAIDLRSETPLGRRVIFMPAVRRPLAFWRAAYWREDALVHELRSLAGLPEPEGSRRISG